MLEHPQDLEPFPAESIKILGLIMDYSTIHDLKKLSSSKNNNYKIFSVSPKNIFTTVFIDHYSLHTPLNKILWAVLGTLKRSKQIEIYAYVKKRSLLSICLLKKHESKNLLA